MLTHVNVGHFSLFTFDYDLVHVNSCLIDRWLGQSGSMLSVALGLAVIRRQCLCKHCFITLVTLLLQVSFKIYCSPQGMGIHPRKPCHSIQRTRIGLCAKFHVDRTNP